MDATNEHAVHAHICNALGVLKEESNSAEDGRIKSIVITKLQEALLWADRIYRPFR